MHCHTPTGQLPDTDRPIILIGQPNVGKSAIFSYLTGRYVDVCNYPGTTVEITRGRVDIAGQEMDLIDTPGVNSLMPNSADEAVARMAVRSGEPWAVLQVADTKNLRRALLLTFQLAEYDLPLVLALNMADEAAARGITVDSARLANVLGTEVISTVATRSEGLEALRPALASARPVAYQIRYEGAIEAAVSAIGELLPAELQGRRGIALALLSGDEEAIDLAGAVDSAGREAINRIIIDTVARYDEALAYTITTQRVRCADCILAQVMRRETPDRPGWAEQAGSLMIHPLWGWPVLLAALTSLYLFVGQLGAGVLVDWLESVVFGTWLLPPLIAVVELVPSELVRDFLIGDYGQLTMALSYGFAIVLPIVLTFFLAFSVLEDSGYLARLAVMANRPFKRMGLNGKAVLPMVLGLGCDTMATLTTRILETRKERIQVTLLLALGVPCSAQLGVLMGMVAILRWEAVALWGAVILLTLFSVGWLAAQLLPGESADFILELPPVRRPQLGNIVVKTAARIEWYLREVLPLFMLGAALLFILDRTGALGLLEQATAPLVAGLLGLPAETASVFLIGFLRRDFGAAGLFTLARAGALDANQLVISLVVITLFVPCIANLLMIVREHGRRTALWVAVFVFPFAFAVGGALNWTLRALGVAF